LACREQFFSFAQLQGLAVGQDGRGQEVEQALVGFEGVHVIEII
jgi:hypothetical protein